MSLGVAFSKVQVSQVVTGAQVMNIAQVAAEKASYIPTADTARLNDHTGIAITNSTIGAGTF